MPTSLIGRTYQWVCGIICAMTLAACGAADQQAAALISTKMPAATIFAEPSTAEAAGPTAIPAMTATQPPTAIPEETIMPDEKPTQPTALGRATLQPAITPTPASAAPANPPFATPASTAPVEIARADLARRQAVAPDTIRVVEVRDVVWPDPGLGCPQPGMAYKQVPVDGQLIRLESGGQMFEYHSGGSKAPFLCAQPVDRDKPPPVSGGEGK